MREMAALETYAATRSTGAVPTPRQVIAALNACSALNRIDTGRLIHREQSTLIHRDVFVATAAVDMYAKCGCLDEAMELFHAMAAPRHCGRSVVTWNCIIFGCCSVGQFDRALELYSRMDCSPNHITFLAAIRACIGLADGRGTDQQANKWNFLEKIRELHRAAARDRIHVFVANSLITAYSKSGSMIEALEVFRGMNQRSVVSWTEIIMGYASNRGGAFALELFDRMLEQGLLPSRVTLLAVLKACCCSTLADHRGYCLKRGKSIHARAARDGFDAGVFVASSLVDMYSKSGSLIDALVVFSGMIEPTTISWNCVIAGSVSSRKPELAIDVYRQMQQQGFDPDAATFVAALKACLGLAEREQEQEQEQASLGDRRRMIKAKSLALGREIHSRAAAGSAGIHNFVSNGLIDMYAKCGSMIEAWQVFQRMPVRCLVSWNCIIFGFAEIGDGERALGLYQRMQDDGCSPNHVTYLAALRACVVLAEKEEFCLISDESKLDCLEKVKMIHSRVGSELQRHWNLANAIVAAYAKCGSMADARDVFDSIGEFRDLVSWNSIILGYAESGNGNEALELYRRMEDEGFSPDDLTYVAVVKACSSLIDEEDQADQNADLQERVRVVRLRAAEIGLSSFVSNSLIDFYSKCRLIAEALEVFDAMPDRSIVSWNCIILGLDANGLSRQALNLYAMLHDQGFVPDAVTFIAALKACGNLGDREAGRRIRLEIVAAGLGKNAAISNSLIDFFGKCGSMAEALQVFESIADQNKSIVSWNALMDGYRRQGDYERVFELFETMKELRFRPNETTFLLLLTVCCYCGMVDRGKELFEAMAGARVRPGVKHCNCMVDLLGRANRLDEAVGVVQRMGMEPNAVVWMTLLGACWKWNNVNVGELAFRSVFGKLTPAADHCGNLYAAACVMMSNLYKL